MMTTKQKSTGITGAAGDVVMQNKIVINSDTGEVNGNIKIKNLEEFLGQQLADFIIKQQISKLSEVICE